MDLYKIRSLVLVLTIYLIAFIPSFSLFVLKKDKDRKSLIKSICLSSILEIVIFSLIYLFPRETIRIFGVPKNIENYAFYSLKILFISSILTPLHYALPIYLLKNEKKKKAILLFSLKLIYVPIFVVMNFTFSTQTALYTIPILDLIYSLVLFLDIIRNNI